MTDVGEKLFCIVTATNAYGSGVAYSNVVGPVAAAAAAGFAFLTSTGVGSSDGNTFSTSAIDTTGAGILIVGLAEFAAGTTGTISDSKGNTWTALTLYVGTGTARSEIWYSKPTTVGSGHTVTLTCPSGATYGSMTFAAFSGGAASPFDVQTGGDGSSTSTSLTPGITPSVDNCLIIANVGSAVDPGTPGPITPVTPAAGGYTMLTGVAFGTGVHMGQRLAYLIQTTAAATDPEWTVPAGDWGASLASFKSS